ncbi:MAG: hypothetical protein J5855_02215 [Mailhella sp.]|nr:hypothetical protein [Mailhella sp.]
MPVKFLRIGDFGSEGAKAILSRALEIYEGAAPKRICTPLTFGMRDPGLWFAAMKLIGGGVSPNGKIWISDEPMNRLEAVPLAMINAGNESAAPVRVLADLVRLCSEKERRGCEGLNVVIDGEPSENTFEAGIAASWREAAGCFGFTVGTAAGDDRAAGRADLVVSFGGASAGGEDVKAQLAVMTAVLEAVKARL